MSRSCEVLVLGAGISACASALLLSEAGLGQVWLMAPTWIGDDPSSLSPALLHGYQEMAALADLSSPAPSTYRNWAEESGDDLGYSQPGMLVVADAQLAERVVGRGDRLRARGVRAEAFDEDGMAALEPRALYPSRARGLYFPDAAKLNGRRTVEAVARLAARRGVRVIQGETIHELRAKDRKVRGVRSSHGEIEASFTVIASDALLESLLPELARPALAKVERPYQLLQPAPEFGEPGPILWDERTGHTWRGLSNGWVRRNGPAPEEDEDHLLPALSRATRWSEGLWRSRICVDKRPLVGPAPGYDGLLLACAYGQRDFDLAPVTGRFLVAWITETDHPEGLAAVVDPRRYTPADRLSGGGTRA